jgi:hypothetical protein
MAIPVTPLSRRERESLPVPQPLYFFGEAVSQKVPRRVAISLLRLLHPSAQRREPLGHSGRVWDDGTGLPLFRATLGGRQWLACVVIREAILREVAWGAESGRLCARVPGLTSEGPVARRKRKIKTEGRRSKRSRRG